MNSSESGRKLNQAVNTTSKAVGGALSQAKGVFSSFWSTFTAPVVAAATTPIVAQQNTDDNAKKTSILNDLDDQHDDNEQLEDKMNAFNIDKPQLKEERDASSGNKVGIVEIGKEARILDSNRQNENLYHI